MKITRAGKKDLNGIAKIGSENFSGLKNIRDAKKWVKCNFLAYPRTRYFVAKKNGKTSGYILWLEKGGFRKESVFELEQIAVSRNFQGQGIGTQLIEKSLIEIKKYLAKRRCVLKAVEVTTGTDNKAQNIYKKTLSAEIECVVKDLFRGDEVIMIARF
ncbi:MAG: GNAT family N-acetyltransferase [Candidatus Staskawiczbacteria bacterium]|jgi:ribosomal protein S18 acetylase RimI-like enzyme